MYPGEFLPFRFNLCVHFCIWFLQSFKYNMQIPEVTGSQILFLILTIALYTLDIGHQREKELSIRKTFSHQEKQPSLHQFHRLGTMSGLITNKDTLDGSPFLISNEGNVQVFTIFEVRENQLSVYVFYGFHFFPARFTFLQSLYLQR